MLEGVTKGYCYVGWAGQLSPCRQNVVKEVGELATSPPDLPPGPQLSKTERIL